MSVGVVFWHGVICGIQGHVLPSGSVWKGKSDCEELVVGYGCGDDKEVAVEGWKIVLSWLQVSVL